MDLSGLLDGIRGSPSVGRLLSHAREGSPVTTGVGDAAKPAVLAALAASWQTPIVVVTARPARAETLAEELAAWLGEGERVLLFPERDTLPYERLAPARETVRDRLAALMSLAEGRPQVIVASALAVAQRTLSLGQAKAALLDLRTGAAMDLETLLRNLAALGYSMEPIVQEPGQASRRGGIVDIFPPTADQPVRVEFMGREIESLRHFDPYTQRSTGRTERVSIQPAEELASVAPQALAALERLDYKRCSSETRERLEDEVSMLREGLGFQHRYFWTPFVAPSTLLEHLPVDALLAVDEEADIEGAIEEAHEQAEVSRIDLERTGEIPKGLPAPLEGWRSVRSGLQAATHAVRLSRWATQESGALEMAFSTPGAYGGQLRRLALDAASGAAEGRRAVIVSQQAHRLAELLQEQGVPASVAETIPEEPPLVNLISGSLTEGWRLADAEPELTLLTDAEVFGFTKQRRATPKRTVNREAFLAELSQGDNVVHVDHGIARFAGMVRMEVDGNEREYLELHYAEGDKLFVPTDQLDRVSKYIGPSDRQPRPTRLGSGDWQRAKARVRKAVQVLAKDLLALYASREALPGYAFSSDTPWQMELEASFPYIETPDQVTAISAVKLDMEAARPMDRLVCGDVGYGKTEVAVRAAFKAVMDGKQVAMLVPTTVLAQQHFQTFHERLAAFPTRVDVLSRFRNDAEQREIVEALAGGSIDIIIGTHRLLQKDISFKNLGLIIIDEEQRFGVAHKEFLKKMRREVDVLTLSATPIPRTLYMALGGIRDMSTMETPPEERLPIKTYVSEFDERLVREAITRELERGGQVYFVHNRVHKIDLVAEKVREAAPEARVAIGHGQMDEKELARVMDDFVHGRTDVLVCTTIIESGLDIPNVNTIIINQADRLGLGQMYQLRGRVGRGAHRAYAYLLYDRRGRLTETATQRLQTIFEATELGAGFQIALRDLEIRGAGNLLGSEQSGFMATIGFDLYVRLLSGAVERLRATMRGEAAPPDREGPEVTIDLPLSAHLPATYVPEINQRLAIYQRLSAAADPEEVGAIGEEMVDRFGSPPPLVRNLLYIVSVRAMAKQAGIQSITVDEGAALLRMREEEALPGDSLGAIVPRGVQAGRTVVRVELNEGWRDRLWQTLELILEAKPAQEPAEVH